MGFEKNAQLKTSENSKTPEETLLMESEPRFSLHPNFKGFDENVPEVIENVVEVLKREPGLNLIEVVQEVGRKSNIKNSALIEAGVKSLISRNIICNETTDNSETSALEAPQSSSTPQMVQNGENLPRFRKKVPSLDENAPEIAKKIYSFFPDSDAEGITINELIKISRKEFSEDDAENTIRNALDIFYEQGFIKSEESQSTESPFPSGNQKTTSSARRTTTTTRRTTVSSARKSKMARQLDFGISELGDKTQELLDSMNQAKQQ